MITVAEASHLILQCGRDWGQCEVPLSDALHRILAEEVSADRDFPPFDRITMDGIGIHFQSFVKGQRKFPIVGVQAAGEPKKTLYDPGSCLEVMTGASTPVGVDAIVRYEDVTIANGMAEVLIETVSQQQNIHARATDRSKDDPILIPGKRISPAEIGVAATVGKSSLLVKRKPRVLIISTGDELVEIDAKPEPHQIRRSNSYAIQQLLANHRFPSDMIHIPDDQDQTTKIIENKLEEFDLLVFSGGVSKGKFDYVPQALEASGVKKLFHRVAQRPGKPFWFGTSDDGKIVFALPGNPVSSFMCTVRYLIPYLLFCEAGLWPTEKMRLGEDFSFDRNLTYFLQVKLVENKGNHMVLPLVGKGSGDLANLADADGFLELPAEKSYFKNGEIFDYYPYRFR